MGSFIRLQKSEVPVLDNLPVPQFESELKRAAAPKPTIVSKQPIHIELGTTSIAPRQRPKGNASSQNLPLVLPSSPSPGNTIASPSPQVLQTTDGTLDATDKSTTPVSPYALKPKSIVIQNDIKTPTKSNVPEKLFEANFPDSFQDTTNVPKTPTSSMGSKKDIRSPTSPLHQHLLNTPKSSVSGHRRNVSDTSAFNK